MYQNIMDIAVGEDGYEYEGVFGKRKAVNRSGRVGASIYIDVDNDTNNTDLILKGLAVLANKTGCRAELDAVEGNDFLDYMKKAVKVIGNKYVYFVVRAEEYVSQSSADGKTFTWDKDNQYDYKPFVTPDEDIQADIAANAGTNDILPF